MIVKSVTTLSGYKWNWKRLNSKGFEERIKIAIFKPSRGINYNFSKCSNRILQCKYFIIKRQFSYKVSFSFIF